MVQPWQWLQNDLQEERSSLWSPLLCLPVATVDNPGSYGLGGWKASVWLSGSYWLQWSQGLWCKRAQFVTFHVNLTTSLGYPGLFCFVRSLHWTTSCFHNPLWRGLLCLLFCIPVSLNLLPLQICLMTLGLLLQCRQDNLALLICTQKVIFCSCKFLLVEYLATASLHYVLTWSGGLVGDPGVECFDSWMLRKLWVWLCRKIAAVAQIANFLGSPFAEAFQKSPPQLLQLVPLKGQEALSEVKLPVATHSMPAATVARILAESFLKARLSG